MKRSFAMIYWKALSGSLERMFDVFFGQTRFPVSKQAGTEKPVALATASDQGDQKVA
jgi:hypothetical protein